MMVSGFLFLFIIVILNIAAVKYGYEVFSDLDSDAKLRKINDNPKKFKTGIALVLAEHCSIITLAIMLFLAFGTINLILGAVWTISRIGEGLMQINGKRSYWGLLHTARQYSVASGAERNELAESGRSVLRTKNSIFSYAQILFSIGTLAYSIVFVISGVVHPVIGWFGIVASILYGLGNGTKLVKPDFNALWNLGGLLIWIFEIVLGGWLLFYPH
jgi:hypothetical protein